MTWEDYDGSVLAKYDGGTQGKDVDSIKGHIVNYLSTYVGTVSVVSGSQGTATYYTDYPVADNMSLPSGILTVQKEWERNKYIGNFLFDYTDTASGVAESGSHDDVYGTTKTYLLRIDVWAQTTDLRDILAGDIENALKYAASPHVNDLYSVGIRGINVINSELVGFDQTDRYIKDVSYHTGENIIYRKGIYFTVNADVRIIPLADPEVYLIGQTNYDIYLAETSAASGSGYDDLVASGVASGTG